LCGIAGIVSVADGPPPEPARLTAMCERLVHRGPDEDGTEIRGRAGFAMRRLSIIDVAGGSQPIFNEDRSVFAVCNGEIYNFRELRRDLEARGHAFASGSDCEVIVHAYEEYGVEFPRKLSGMFAIGLFDATRQRLLLVRDPIGIKPLYYTLARGQLSFASELKALLAGGCVERELDLDALGEFISWEYVPGRATLLRGVHKLEPGTQLRLESGTREPVLSRYWDVPEPRDDDAEVDARTWMDRVDQTLRDCVQRQLVSDVPLGAFLSGGVDSSLMVASMGEAHAFSIGFDDPSYDELPWARRAAEHLGVALHSEIVEPKIVNLFQTLNEHLDDPIGDFSIFPTYLVSRLAREQVKVVLSGDGGDELFGGYDTYLADAWSRIYRRVPRFARAGLVEPVVRALRPRPQKKGWVNKARHFVGGHEHDAALGHARWRMFAGDADRQLLFEGDAASAFQRPAAAHIVELFERAGERSPLDRSLYVDLHSYLCDNILVKVDRMSMATSLEARVPYLDTELVELAFRVPTPLKVARGRTKILLKRIAARHLPAACVYRTKQGFSIPIKNWLGGELRPLAEELLSERRLRSQGIFSTEQVKRLWNEHVDGRANHSHVLWSLMVFQAWAERWLGAE
jgi:asparagine synthase (glutamine-hydrolysing)